MASRQAKVDFKIEAHGDQGIIVVLFNEEVSMLCRRIRTLDRLIAQGQLKGVVETVPAYSSLAVYYSPSETTHSVIATELVRLLEFCSVAETEKPREFELPVCYGESFGPDLDQVAELHGLTPFEVVDMHVNALYTVAMIGFTPGFPYLLGLPEALSTPRRDLPRQEVAAGSVGIGGRQTGIYSLNSPGGWNIIGRTPARLFQADAKSPSLLMTGDTVRFVKIDAKAYREIEQNHEGGQSVDFQNH